MLAINDLNKSYHYADLRQDVLLGLDFEMQAGSSILAQANQAPQIALSLLG